MKICYIAHPICGEIEKNLKDLRRIIRKLNIEDVQTVPFCPYYADVVSMDDNDEWDRQRGIANNTNIILSGIITELWLTGEKISKGMEEEIRYANMMNIPVIDLIGKL